MMKSLILLSLLVSLTTLQEIVNSNEESFLTERKLSPASSSSSQSSSYTATATSVYSSVTKKLSSSSSSRPAQTYDQKHYNSYPYKLKFNITRDGSINKIPLYVGSQPKQIWFALDFTSKYIEVPSDINYTSTECVYTNPFYDSYCSGSYSNPSWEPQQYPWNNKFGSCIGTVAYEYFYQINYTLGYYNQTHSYFLEKQWYKPNTTTSNNTLKRSLSPAAYVPPTGYNNISQWTGNDLLGIIGLPATSSSDSSTYLSSFVQNVYAQTSSVYTPMFSLYIYDAKSFMTIGGYDGETVVNDYLAYNAADINWKYMYQSSSDYWNVAVTNIHVDFNNLTTKNTKTPQSTLYATFDSTVFDFQLPQSDFNSFATLWKGVAGCSQAGTKLVCTCLGISDKKMPQIGFTLGSTYHYFNGQDYMTYDGVKTCTANITANPALKNSMVFGLTWLTGYYSIFDQSSSKVGFAGDTTWNPSGFQISGLSNSKLLLLLLLLIVVVIGIVGIYCYCKKKNQRILKEYQQNNAKNNTPHQTPNVQPQQNQNQYQQQTMQPQTIIVQQQPQVIYQQPPPIIVQQQPVYVQQQPVYVQQQQPMYVQQQQPVYVQQQQQPPVYR